MADKKYDWEKVDFSLQDCEICKITGAPRQRVSQVRKDRGYAKPKNHKQRLKSAKSELSKMDTSGYTLQELAKLTGVNVGHTRNVLKELGKSHRISDGRSKSKYNWEKLSYHDIFKWSLADVARHIGNGCTSALVAQKRGRTKKKIYGPDGLLSHYPNGSFFDKRVGEIDSELNGLFSRNLIQYVWDEGTSYMSKFDNDREMGLSTVDRLMEMTGYEFDPALIEYIRDHVRSKELV